MLKTAPQNTAQVVPAREEDLPEISRLASVIWHACYPGIISEEQIDYMLARMYGLETLREEIRSQGILYQKLQVGGALVGFASYGPAEEPAAVKLHKLYLAPQLHGLGFGSLLLKHCEQEIRKQGVRRLALNVNKRNGKAIAAYQRNGFVIAQSVVADIGGGFAMDDYVMEKRLGDL